MVDKETKKTEETEELEQNVDEIASDEEEKFTFVDDPEFEIDAKEDCAYEVKVTIPVSNEEAEATKMFAELKGEVELPGFRKGRAPIKLVEKKFSKAVKGDVERKLVSESFQKLIKDEDLKPIDTPDVDGLDEETERKEGDPLTFTLKFEVSPKVELGKYRGLKIDRPILEIDDAEIESTILNIQERHAVFETLDDGVAAENDQIVMDFEGKIDGEAFQGGSATDYPYILGSKRFFPEFETILLGSSASDELKCDITFPDDYSAENLRGKEAAFTINVKEVKRRNMPEVNDDFAKQAGYENLEDLRTKVKDQLEKSSANQTKSVVESSAIKAIVDDSKFEIPQTMLANVAKNYHDEEVERLMQMRMPASRIEEMEEDLNKMANEKALERIKSMVILNEIGEAEGIEVTEEDFEKEAQNLASQYGTDIDIVSKFMTQDDQRSTYENRILYSKTMAVIIEAAKVTDKVVTREEFDKQQEDED